MKQRVITILQWITLELFGERFFIEIQQDKKGGERIYIQIKYFAPCSKTGEVKEWKGRKWYLSEHMTDDEIVKTVYLAFETAVKHEILEGFKYKDLPLFNPHVSYLELHKISHLEETRNG